MIPRAQLKEDNISVVLVDGERNVVERVTRDNLREVLQHNIRVPGSFTPFVARATGALPCPQQSPQPLAELRVFGATLTVLTGAEAPP